jgi:hypothetical protein
MLNESILKFSNFKLSFIVLLMKITETKRKNYFNEKNEF